MTFKEFMKGAFYLPARVFSGLSNLTLGSYQKYNNGTVRTDQEGNPQTNRGLLGLAVDATRFIVNFVFDAVKYIARSISNFISNHLKAIAVAFWVSLAVAAIVAITVALWPAALAAITSISIAGVSIASVVGTGVAAQVFATAGVAAFLSGAAVLLTAAVVNTYVAIRDFFVTCCKAAKQPSEVVPGAPEAELVVIPSVNPALSALSTTSSSEKEQAATVAEVIAPVESSPLFKAPTEVVASNEEVQAASPEAVAVAL